MSNLVGTTRSIITPNASSESLSGSAARGIQSHPILRSDSWGSMCSDDAVEEAAPAAAVVHPPVTAAATLGALQTPSRGAEATPTTPRVAIDRVPSAPLEVSTQAAPPPTEPAGAAPTQRSKIGALLSRIWTGISTRVEAGLSAIQTALGTVGGWFTAAADRVAFGPVRRQAAAERQEEAAEALREIADRVAPGRTES